MPQGSNNQESPAQGSIKDSLRSGVKGAAFVFAGAMAGVFLWFVSRILILRYLSKSDFGLYSITLAMAVVVAYIASFALQEGAARQVAICVGRGDMEGAHRVARGTFRVGAASGVIVGAMLLAFSGQIAEHVFYKPELRPWLMAMALYVPCFSITQALCGILRGHNAVAPKVLYFDVGHPLLFVLAAWPVLVYGMPAVTIMWVFSITILVVAIALVWDVSRKVGPGAISLRGEGDSFREILVVSLPIMSVGLMQMVFGWMDTLMLGRYSTADAVAGYGGAVMLANFMTVSYAAFGFIFLQIGSGLHAQQRAEELKRTYQVLTKWIFASVFPVFFVLFLFPEMTITVAFGERFLDAAVPLRILLAAYLAQAFLGATISLMLVLGAWRALTVVSIGGICLNVLLNYAFIKHLGMAGMGAALATAISVIYFNAANTWIIYRESRIHPFTAGHVRPCIGACVSGAAIYALSKSLPLYKWMPPLYLALFAVGYVASLLLLRAVEGEDLYIIDSIARRTGADLSGLKAFLSRFIYAHGA